MRLLVLAALLLVPLAAAQESGRSVEHGTWTQFEPHWREGPATVPFGDRAADVPFGARYATDGATWFYAASVPPPTRPGIPEHCGDALPANGTHVLLDEERCRFAAHPSIACSELAEACCDLEGPCVVAPTSPPPTPLSQLLDTCGNPAIPAKCTPLPAALAPLAVLLALALTRLQR